jgi:AbrB family looped-hinge helix DNA binding protein
VVGNWTADLDCLYHLTPIRNCATHGNSRIKLTVGGFMRAVKVLPKGQITIPREIRKNMKIKVGDTLVIEKTGDGVILKKNKTLFDYIGSLPDIGLTVDEMRDKAIEKAVKENE